MQSDEIFAGLNPEQRRAVEAVRGPVCILAGAGTGKTTTITRRIANQVAAGVFRPAEILAVTFTDKAAGEMRARLRRLGAEGVEARTFHSAALAFLHRHAPESVGKIISSKALPLRHLANSLPRPYKFRPAGDLATEIEWAKNRRIAPREYVEAVAAAGTTPPIPPDLMVRIYAQYEERKAAQGYADFEDLLERAIVRLQEDAWAREDFRNRYRAFTVDEYQDVNLLQQTLLDLWLGDRDDVCAVGDDYQAIYAFTGATAEHLLRMPQRYPHATIVRLEQNYRSSPQVLARANALVPRLGGVAKNLSAVRPDGPEPAVLPFATVEEETAWVVDRIRASRAEGTPWEQMAILVRTNARTADYEEALSDAEIPFQGASFLEREGARQVLRLLRGADGVEVAADVRRRALDVGWAEEPPDGMGERELTRQNDLARLVRLADSFDDGSRTIADFVADLKQRFDPRADGAGVNLLTYHRAKGLEFEAVFLPRLVERELPCRAAKTPEEIAEERRLLYVGMTRAKRVLALTWSGKPSRFLTELGVAVRAAAAPREEREVTPEFAALRAWRRKRALADDVPAYIVFADATLHELAARRPRTRGELAGISGIGPAKLERYGADVLAVLADPAAYAPSPAAA